MDLPSVSFFGRTLDEYLRFFALDLELLRGQSVLDVAAGPSSFTAEACRRGVNAVAVDPLYGCSPECLEQHVMLDYRAMFAKIRAKPELFQGRTFASIDEAEVSRRSAARRFLVDYGAHFVHNRYVGAALPRLPFADRSQDLVLCAHLLFTYAKLFDYAFHLAACRELVRVSRDEVRLHPVVDASGTSYEHLDRLIADLGELGIEASIVGLDYEFFSGSDSMLVLKRSI